MWVGRWDQYGIIYSISKCDKTCFSYMWNFQENSTSELIYWQIWPSFWRCLQSCTQCQVGGCIILGTLKLQAMMVWVTWFVLHLVVSSHWHSPEVSYWTFGLTFYGLIYTHCQELMKSVYSHGSGLMNANH
jgi:hypothetical protein